MSKVSEFINTRQAISESYARRLKETMDILGDAGIFFRVRGVIFASVAVDGVDQGILKIHSSNVDLNQSEAAEFGEWITNLYGKPSWKGLISKEEAKELLQNFDSTKSKMSCAGFINMITELSRDSDDEEDEAAEEENNSWRGGSRP